MGPNEESYIVIRADADSQIGAGHVMRCMALAQAWQLEGGRAILLGNCESDAIRRLISDAGIEFIPLVSPHPDPSDLEITLNLLQTLSTGKTANRKSEIGNSPWLVLDGYRFDASYQQAIRSAGYRLLVIDDTVRLPIYHADILLNQNLGAETLKYTCGPDTTLLLGSRYVLLRQEFLAWSSWNREISKVAHKVLVTMGGSDPYNVTLKVIRVLEQVYLDDLDVIVVVGGSNPHYEVLQSAIQTLPFKIRLERNATNMPELMAWADIAILAAGSTSWEVLFMRLPSMVLAWADNQRGIAKVLGESGVALNLGWHEQVTDLRMTGGLISISNASSRKGMADKGNGLVDGAGSHRTVKAMLAGNLSLRRVRDADCELLWKWVNDPDVRVSAFFSNPISWESHRQWFSAKMKDPRCIQFIAMNPRDVLVGQVRFDIENDEAEIDVSVDGNLRGNGYAPFLIRKGVRELEKIAAVYTVNAFVKPGNAASIRAFQRAGFVCLGMEMVKGHQAMHLMWRKK